MRNGYYKPQRISEIIQSCCYGVLCFQGIFNYVLCFIKKRWTDQPEWQGVCFKAVNSDGLLFEVKISVGCAVLIQIHSRSIVRIKPGKA